MELGLENITMGTLTTPTRLYFSHRADGVLRISTNRDLKKQGMPHTQLILVILWGSRGLEQMGIPLLYAFIRLWVSLS